MHIKGDLKKTQHNHPKSHNELSTQPQPTPINKDSVKGLRAQFLCAVGLDPAPSQLFFLTTLCLFCTLHRKADYTLRWCEHIGPHMYVYSTANSCAWLIYLSTSSLGHTVATSSGKDSSPLTAAWGTLPVGKPWPGAVRSRERENYSSSHNSPPRHYPHPRIRENALSMKMLGRNGLVPPIPPPGKWSSNTLSQQTHPGLHTVIGGNFTHGAALFSCFCYSWPYSY